MYTADCAKSRAVGRRISRNRASCSESSIGTRRALNVDMHSLAAVIVFTSLLSQVSAPTQAVAHRRINVAVGQTATVPFAKVRNFMVSPAQVADVRVSRDGKLGLVVGLTSGNATLVLVFQDNSQTTYDIKVA
jgi:hypothetical protein